jgi:hypothetical protein
MNKTQTATPAVNFRRASFAKLPACVPDALGFFESVLGFANLAGVYFRVTAADQRRYFGGVPFGKCAISVSQYGIVKLIKTKAFGKDFDTSEIYFDQSTKTWRSTWCHAVIKTPAIF